MKFRTTWAFRQHSPNDTIGRNIVLVLLVLLLLVLIGRDPSLPFEALLLPAAIWAYASYAEDVGPRWEGHRFRGSQLNHGVPLVGGGRVALRADWISIGRLGAACR